MGRRGALLEWLRTAIVARLRAGIHDGDVAERAQTAPPTRSSPPARPSLDDEWERDKRMKFVAFGAELCDGDGSASPSVGDERDVVLVGGVGGWRSLKGYFCGDLLIAALDDGIDCFVGTAGAEGVHEVLDGANGMRAEAGENVAAF